MLGFGWIMQKWRNRRIAKHRMLYQYWDGEKTRYGDPFRIWRDIHNDPTIDLETMAPMVDAEKEPETGLVIAAVARAFDVKNWDSATQTGLIDWEILNLFFELDAFTQALKKNISRGQTSPNSTDLTYSTTPAAPVDQTETTNVSSGSGSTVTEKAPEPVSESLTA